MKQVRGYLVAPRLDPRVKPEGHEVGRGVLFYEHPVVVPQSSQTMQWPLTFILSELQLLH